MRAMVAAFDTGDLDRVAEFVHEDYLDHQGLPDLRPVRGVDGFRHLVEVARTGYSDLSVEVADLLEGEDRCAARLVWRGIRPSGDRTQRETLEIVRVEAGRAVEHWGGGHS